MNCWLVFFRRFASSWRIPKSRGKSWLRDFLMGDTSFITRIICFCRDLFRKRSTRKSKRRACSPLGSAATACLTGSGGTNPGTPVSIGPAVTGHDYPTPPGSAHSSPRKYRGSRTSTSLKVKGLLGRVWARDSKSKSCENLHVL